MDYSEGLGKIVFSRAIFKPTMRAFPPSQARKLKELPRQPLCGQWLRWAGE